MIRKTLTTLAIVLGCAVAYSLPTKPPATEPKVYRFPGMKFGEGTLIGWEVHLKTSTEIAICGNPQVLADARVITCEGIRSLELR